MCAAGTVQFCVGQDPAFCDGKPYEFYPDPTNCRYYYECSAGGQFRFLCENDWLYDSSLQYCDYQDRVDCGEIPICDDNGENCQERKLV